MHFLHYFQDARRPDGINRYYICNFNLVLVLIQFWGLQWFVSWNTEVCSPWWMHHLENHKPTRPPTSRQTARLVTSAQKHWNNENSRMDILMPCHRYICFVFCQQGSHPIQHQLRQYKLFERPNDLTNRNPGILSCVHSKDHPQHL